MSTVGTFVANGHGQDYGNAAVQQTLYAVVEAFSCLKVWTRLRELRQQWALCRERSGGAKCGRLSPDVVRSDSVDALSLISIRHDIPPNVASPVSVDVVTVFQ